MQNVIVFAGCMQSGKSSSAKFITGHRMKQAGMINWFDISQEGDLLIEAVDDAGNVTRNAILDLYRDDFEFFQYADQNIWDKCKIYSFAKILKESAIGIFGLDRAKVYGSDADKNSLSPIKWTGVFEFLDKKRQKEILAKHNNKLPEFMTNREVLQEYGNVCRRFNESCWIDAAWRNIKADGYPYVVIDDCRYVNEVNISKKNGAKIVLLTAQKIKDTHSSEKILEADRDLFDFVIDNEKMTLQEKNEEIVKILNSTWTQVKIS